MHKDMAVLFNTETNLDLCVCVCVSQAICRNETLQWWDAVCYFPAAESSGGECKQSQDCWICSLISQEKCISLQQMPNFSAVYFRCY